MSNVNTTGNSLLLNTLRQQIVSGDSKKSKVKRKRIGQESGLSSGKAQIPENKNNSNNSFSLMSKRQYLLSGNIQDSFLCDVTTLCPLG